MSKKRSTPPTNILERVNWNAATSEDTANILRSGIGFGRDNDIYDIGPTDLGRVRRDLNPTYYEGLIEDEDGRITARPEDWQNLAAENQPVASQIAKGIGRTVMGTGFKFLEGVGLLGSAIVNAGREALNSEDTDFWEDTTDNALVQGLFKTEELVKDSPYFRVYKPSDWDDRGILEQIGSTAWWADEFSDGLSFSLSSMIGAGMIGDLQIGSKIASSLGTARTQAKAFLDLGKRALGQGAKSGTMGGLSSTGSNFIKAISKGIPSVTTAGKYGDFISQVGLLTTQEALFEARDTGHQVQQKLLEEAGYDVSGMTPEEQLDFLNNNVPNEEREEIKKKKGQAMQNTFTANMTTLFFSNAVEVAGLNSLMGKGLSRLTGSSKPAKQGVNLGENLYDQASIVERKGIKRFIGKGSRPRAIATNIAAQAVSEGLYEENIQNSIQKISSQFDGEGIIDYIKDVGDDMIDNTFSGDKEAWKSIVTGGIIGGLLGVGSGIRQYNQDANKRVENIDRINSAKANLVNLKGNEFLRDEDGNILLDEQGNPQYNGDAIVNLLANQNKIKDLADLHDLYKQAGNEEIADVLWNDAITELSLSYLEAGYGNDLIDQIKAVGTTKEEALQANGLTETQETKADGRTVGVQERAAKMLETAQNVKNDYEAITSVIPDTEGNSLRINSAVKIASRLRELNKKRGEAEGKYNELISKIGLSPVVDINSSIDKIEALKELKKEIQKESPQAAEEVQKTVDNLTKEVEFKKDTNRSILGEQGIAVPTGLGRLVDTNPNTPDKIALKKQASKVAEYEAAIQQQLEKYNDLLTNPAKLQEQISNKLDETAKEADQNLTTEQELSNVRPGDLVELTDKKTGTVTTAPVQVDRNTGTLTIGGIDINSNIQALYSSIRVLNEQEKQDYIENQGYAYRVGQLNNRIQEIRNDIERLRAEQEVEVENLLKAEDTLYSLRSQRFTKKSRISEKILNDRIEATERLIRKSEEAIGRYDDLIADRNRRIEEIEFNISERNVETNVDSLKQELDLLRQEYKDTRKEREEAVTLLNKLKDYYDFLKEYWRKIFPNKKRVFEEYEAARDILDAMDPIELENRVEEASIEAITKAYKTGQEYSDFKQDIANTAQEIKERETIVNELDKRLRSLKRRGELLAGEINQYESFLAQLINPGVFAPAKGQEETETNVPTPNGEYVILDNADFRAKKNIADGLFTTTGNSTTNTPAMNRWFKYTEQVKPGKNTKLLAVTIDHPVFGVGKEYDVYKDEGEAFKTKDNIKVIALESFSDPLGPGGVRPIRIDGEIVSTSLVEITPNKKSLQDFKLRDGDTMFHNKDGLTDQEVSSIIEDYRTWTDNIKNNPEKKHIVGVLGKSFGFVNEGPEITALQAFGESTPTLHISTKTEVKKNGLRLGVEIGMGYVNYNGRPVPAKTRKINQEEAQAILKALKAYGKIRTTVNNEQTAKLKERGGRILDKIKSIVFLGKSSNPNFSTYFVKGEQNFVFGNNIISTYDLMNGKYDTELLEHLTELNHQISFDHIKRPSDEKYTSITGEEYANYNDYLLNPNSNNRQNFQVPIKFAIQPQSDDVNNRQIDGMYLFLDGQTKRTVVEKQPQRKTTPAQVESQEPNESSFYDMEAILAQADEIAAAKSVTAEEEASDMITELLGDNPQEITLDNGNTYLVSIQEGTKGMIVRKDDRNKIISATSPIGKQVLDKVNWDSLGEKEVQDIVEQEPNQEDLGVFNGLEFEAQENNSEQAEAQTIEFEETIAQDDIYAEFNNSLEIVEPSEQERWEALNLGDNPVSERDLENSADEDSKFLLASRITDYNQADVAKEISELERLVGSKALAGIVRGLIKGKAFGQTLSDGRILLSDIMTEGTAYHEAFHRVFSGIISDSERNKVLQDWRNRNISPDAQQQLEKQQSNINSYNQSLEQYNASLQREKENLSKYEDKISELKEMIATNVAEGNSQLVEKISNTLKDYQETFNIDSALDRINELNKSIEDTRKYILEAESIISSLTPKSDFQVEEELAEEFREYMLTKQHDHKPTENIFKRIWNYLRALLRIPSAVKDRLFYKISTGTYVDVQPRQTIVGDKFMLAPDEVSAVRERYGTTVERDLYEGLTYGFLESLVSNNFNVNDVLNFNNGTLTPRDTARYKLIFSNVFDGAMNVLSKNPSFSSHVEFFKANKKNIFDNFSNSLKRYNINLKEEQDNKVIPDEENRGKDTLGIIESIEFNTKSSVPNAIKLLIASLPSMTRQGKYRSNQLGLPKLSNYKTNLAKLHNALAGLETIQEMRDKVLELSVETPEYKVLLKRLGIPNKGEVTTANTPENIVRLQTQFKQQFDKANYTFLSLLIDENGKALFRDANSERASDLIKQKWRSNFRTLPKNRLKLVNGRYVYDPKYFEKHYKGKGRPDEILSFYKDLGIIFSDEDSVDVSGVLTPLSGYFYDAVQKGTMDDLFSREADLGGWINQLIKEELKGSADATDNQHINSEGKTVYSINLNNYLTLAARKINKNQADYLTWDAKTNTGNPLARNSHFLKLGYKIKVLNLEGAEVIGLEKSVDGKPTSKLSRTESLAQQFVSVMNGVFPFIRQSDRKIEYAIALEHSNGSRVGLRALKAEDIQDAVEVFKGYLADELLSSWMLVSDADKVGSDIPTYNQAGRDLRFFKGIFNDSLTKQYKDIISNNRLTRELAISRIDKFVNEPSVVTAIQNMLDSKSEQFFNEFVNNGVLTERAGKYVNNALSTEIVGDEGAYEKEELMPFINRFTYNYLIGNIEQSKLFTGDTAFYKIKESETTTSHDFFKRTGGLGGTGKTLRNDSEFNEWLQENKSRPDKRIIDGKIQTWVFDDPKVTSKLKNDYFKVLTDQFGLTAKNANDLLSPYEGYDEADAQGYITLPEYREMFLREGTWNESLEMVYQKAVRNEPLTTNEILTLPARKPQYFGPQTYKDLYVPTFYKLSLMPLIPSVIGENSTLGKLNADMLANGVGIVTFTSGNKVGKLQGQLFYNEEGSYNEGPKVIQELDYDFMKIQLDVSPEKHHKVTFGTQFRKLILTNLLGKTLYKNKNGGKGFNGKTIISKYNYLVQQQIELEMNNILKKLDAKVLSNGNITVNKARLAEVLVDEAFKRAAPNNVIDDIKQALGKGRGVEIMVTRPKIESILMSIMNNTVVHNKVLGDMLVQASVTGFENKPRNVLQEDVKDKSWASDLETLNFYQYGPNGTTAMEVYLPHRFKELYGQDVNIKDINPKLLELVGFRIPTQGLNSMEAIKVKGFLPQEAGNLIILPSEIVAKAGSDFDIDKLTVFLPNYKITRDWKTLIQDIQATNLRDRLGINPKQINQDYIEYLEEEFNNGVRLDALDGMIFNLYREAIRNNPTRYKTNIEYEAYDSKNPTRGGIQNEIIRITRTILLAPENFKELITPVSSSILQDEARMIRGLKSSLIERKGRESYFDLDFIMETREAYLTGKDGVGIAASNLTHHTLSQMAGLRISPGQTYINLTHHNVDGRIDLSRIWDKENEDKGNTKAPTISDTISAFLNGFVDIAKDPFLKTINADTETAGTYLYLLRAGVPLREAVLFMNQPIIIDYLNNLKLGRSLFRTARKTNKSMKEIQQETRDSYRTSNSFNLSDATDKEQYLKLLSQEGLKNGIKREGKNFNEMQQQVLTDFITYQDASKKLLELSRATNSDTRGTGPSMETASDLLERFNDIKRQRFFENVDKFETETVIGTFNKAIDNTIKTYKTVFPILQREDVRDIMNHIKTTLKLSDFISQDSVDKTLKVAENDFISFLFQNSKKGSLPRGRLIERYFTGEQSIPKMIATIKGSNNVLRNNLLIQELYPILSTSGGVKEKTTDFDNLKFFSRRIIKEHADDLTYAWEELFNQQPNLAQAIFEFAVLQSSFNNSPLEFLKYAPPRFTSQALHDYINNDVMESDLDLESFYDKFLRNNWRNSDLVPYTNRGIMTKGGFRDFLTKDWSSITAHENYKNYPYVKTSVKDAQGNTKYLLFYNTLETKKDEVRNKEYPIFRRIGALGNGYFFKEYATDVSVITENRAPNETLEPIITSSNNEGYKNDLKRDIIGSTLSNTDKGRYLQMLDQAETIEQIAAIRQQICK